MNNQKPQSSPTLNKFSKQMQSTHSNTPDHSYQSYHRVIVMNDRIILRRESCGHRKHSYNEESLKNLECNKTKGKLSKQSYLHVRKHLVAWLTSLEAGKNSGFRRTCRIKYVPIMITLTLSAEQSHTDMELKRVLFGRFIEWCKIAHDVKYFFIRYESQKNGNIHAHLIVDKYIDKKIIQDKWNSLQNRLDYIDKFEQKYKHRNPPSTDVRAIDEVNDTIDYLIGYVMKKSENRAIEGRQYGMSIELKEMDLYNEIVDSAWSEALSKFENSDNVFKHHSDFYSVYVFKHNFIQEFGLSWLHKDMLKYYSEMFRRFYFNLGYEFS